MDGWGSKVAGRWITTRLGWPGGVGRAEVRRTGLRADGKYSQLGKAQQANENSLVMKLERGRTNWRAMTNRHGGYDGAGYLKRTWLWRRVAAGGSCLTPALLQTANLTRQSSSKTDNWRSKPSSSQYHNVYHLVYELTELMEAITVLYTHSLIAVIFKNNN